MSGLTALGPASPASRGAFGPASTGARRPPSANNHADSEYAGYGDSDDDGGSRGGSRGARPWPSPRGRASGGRPRPSGGRGGATGGASKPRAAAAPLLWIQCDEASCGKWRRVRARDAPSDDEAPWLCSMNPDPRWASCDVPQAVPDDEIDRQLEAEGGPLPGPADRDGGGAVPHAATCARPPLDDCTDADFEDDLCTFLAASGDADGAKALRARAVTLAGAPLDVFGLYRAVVGLGGLSRAEARSTGTRYGLGAQSGLDWGGAVFPQLRNCTAATRAASVGASLASLYRRYLAPYERAHAAADLPPPPPPPGGDPLAFLADVASQGEPPLPGRAAASAPAAAWRKRGGAASDDDAASPLAKRAKGGAGGGGGAFAPAAQHHRWGAPRAPATVAAELRAIETAPGRAAPGDLLLAPDPADLNRHWPVAVAAARDLPAAVLGGGTAGVAPSRDFPQRLDAASDAGRVRDALPVVVVGTTACGWVEAAATRPFTASAAAAAAAAVAPAARRTADGDEADPDADAADAECARALKVAAQSARAPAPAGRAAAAAASHAAGAAAAASRLLALEGRLPLDGAVYTGAYEFWAAWRRAVARAESGAELAPHVASLAHQLKPTALTGGAPAAAALCAAVRAGLDMAPPPGAAAPSAEPVKAEGGGDVCAPSPPPKPPLARAPSVPGPAGPGIPAVDAAVAAIEDAIDWAKLTGAAPTPAPSPAPTPAPTPVSAPPLPPAAAPRAAAPPPPRPSLPDLHHCGSANNLHGGLLAEAAAAAAAVAAATAACAAPSSSPSGSPTAAAAAAITAAAAAVATALPPASVGAPAPGTPATGTVGGAAQQPGTGSPPTPATRGGGNSAAATPAPGVAPSARAAAGLPDTVSVGSADGAAAPHGADLLESLRSMAESEARAGA